MIGANDTAITETFLINSDGFLNDILSATNPISLSGAGASSFTVSPLTYLNTDGANTQATFTVTLPPTNTGTSNATISLNNATPGSPNMTFNVQGEGPTSAAGTISESDMNWIGGYAYNPLNLSDTLNIEVIISGGPTQIFSANQANTQAQNITGSPDHGFEYATPMLSVGTHTVTVYAEDPLNGAKTLLGTTSVTSQNSLFDEHYYLQQNPDVAAAVAAGSFATGYDHYIAFGQFEGRSPSPFWNESYYLQMNPDVAAAVADGKVSSGFMQFYEFGQYENRPGVLYFNQDYYLANNPDVAAAVSSTFSAYTHYVLYGQYEGRSPIKYFSPTVYNADNPDVLPYISGEPFNSDYEQFVMYGQYENRVASNFFNEQVYLQDNPDVAAVVPKDFPTGFQHWLMYGQYENRTAV